MTSLPQPAIDQVTSTSARLTFNELPPVFQGNSDASVTDYVITVRSIADGSQFNLTLPAVVGSYTVMGLNPNSAYEIDIDYLVSRTPGSPTKEVFKTSIPAQTVVTSKYNILNATC